MVLSFDEENELRDIVKARRKGKKVGQEKLFVDRWLAKFHPDALQWTRIRLGPVGDTTEARALGVTRRWADAIFIKDGVVNIVEAKLKSEAGAVAQLELYKKLFPETPEFSQFHSLPVNMIFLAPSVDPVLAELASEKGIEVVTVSFEELGMTAPSP